MTVYEIVEYFEANKERIKKEILEKKYKLQPVKRVYIPKKNREETIRNTFSSGSFFTHFGNLLFRNYHTYKIKKFF